MSERYEHEGELIVVTACCRRRARLEPVPPGEMPGPPGALLNVTASPPEEWTGHEWVCEGCGEVVGFAYDYGTIDLGLVTDEQLGGP